MPFPTGLAEVLADNLDGFGVYPPNDGTPELLAAIRAGSGRATGLPCRPTRSWR